MATLARYPRGCDLKQILHEMTPGSPWTLDLMP